MGGFAFVDVVDVLENGWRGLGEVWARLVSSLGLYDAEVEITEVMPRCGDVDVGDWI